MAKKNQVYIDVVIDDQGTTKRVAVNAKKLGMELDKAGAGSERASKGTDKLSKSNKDLDRNMRGTAKMSSNTTKEFSKMQQGMGGLVGAYATLAAQVFAVSAAFQFLQSASDMRNLIAGQEALGAITGTAYKTITNSIIEATDAQIKYGDAAKAAAIGTAAGLTAGQLTQLGTAAKNVSFALGRDLTDSFNRLVRGVTKAEPELLDELGIILRLEPATEKYALSIGKAAKDLDAFERTQAVTNEVLSQAQNKFAAIQELMDPNAAALAKFTKSFDDLINTVKIGLINTLTPLLSFLSENTGALTAALTLFALPIVKSIIPNLNLWSEAAKKNAEKQKGYSEQYRERIKTDTEVAKQAFAKRDKAAEAANKKAEKRLKGRSTTSAGLNFIRGGTDSASGSRAAKKIITNALKQTKDGKKVETGYLKGMDEKQVKNLAKSYAIRTEHVKLHGKRTRDVWKGITTSAGVMNMRLRSGWASTMSFMSAAAAGVGKAVGLAMSAASFVGFAIMIYQAGKALMEYFYPISDELKRQKKLVEELTDRYKTLKEEMAGAKTAREQYLSGMEITSNIGKQLASIDVGGLLDKIEQIRTISPGTDGLEKMRKDLEGVIEGTIDLNSGFEPLRILFEDSTISVEKYREELVNLSNTLVKQGLNIDNLGRAQQKLDEQRASFNKGLKVSPLTTLTEAAEELYNKTSLALTTTTQEQKNFDDAILESGLGMMEQAALIKNTRIELERLNNLKVDKRGYGKFSMLGQTGELSPEQLKQAAIRKQEDILQAAYDEEERLYNLRQKQIQNRRDTIGQVEELTEEQEKLRHSSELYRATEDELQDRMTARNKVMEEALKLKSASTSVDAKLNNLQEQRAASDKKFGEVQDKLIAAQVEQTVAIESGTVAQQARANLNVILAEGELRIAQETNRVEGEKIDKTERDLLLQREMNKILLARVQIEARLNAARRALEWEKMTGGGTRGSRTKLRGMEDTQLKEQLATARSVAKQAGLAYAQARADMILQETGRLAKRFPGLMPERIKNMATATADDETAGLLAKSVTADDTVAALEQKQSIRAVSSETFFRTLEGEKEELLIQRSMIGLLNTNVKLRQLEAQYFAATGREAEGATLKRLKEYAVELENQEFMLNAQIELADGLRQGFEGAFASIIDGTKSAKQAFADMARSMLQMIAQIITKLLVMKMLEGLGGLFGGGSKAVPLDPAKVAPKGSLRSIRGNAAFGMQETRYGGIVDPPRGYSQGGIARGRDAGYGAVMHGTEAVVPLPNNRSIPVNLNGAGQQNNNVTVNVSMDGSGGGQQSSSNSNQGKMMGELIAAAVQEELQQQKRSGGILNPYGAA